MTIQFFIQSTCGLGGITSLPDRGHKALCPLSPQPYAPDLASKPRTWHRWPNEDPPHPLRPPSELGSLTPEPQDFHPPDPPNTLFKLKKIKGLGFLCGWPGLYVCKGSTAFHGPCPSSSGLLVPADPTRTIKLRSVLDPVFLKTCPSINSYNTSINPIIGMTSWPNSLPGPYPLETPFNLSHSRFLPLSTPLPNCLT